MEVASFVIKLPGKLIPIKVSVQKLSNPSTKNTKITNKRGWRFLLKTMLGNYSPMAGMAQGTLIAGGKPSTRFPPEGLVE